MSAAELRGFGGTPIARRFPAAQLRETRHGHDRILTLAVAGVDMARALELPSGLHVVQVLPAPNRHADGATVADRAEALMALAQIVHETLDLRETKEALGDAPYVAEFVWPAELAEWAAAQLRRDGHADDVQAGDRIANGGARAMRHVHARFRLSAKLGGYWCKGGIEA